MAQKARQSREGDLRSGAPAEWGQLLDGLRLFGGNLAEQRQSICVILTSLGYILNDPEAISLLPQLALRGPAQSLGLFLRRLAMTIADSQDGVIDPLVGSATLRGSRPPLRSSAWTLRAIVGQAYLFRLDLDGCERAAIKRVRRDFGRDLEPAVIRQWITRLKDKSAGRQGGLHHDWWSFANSERKFEVEAWRAGHRSKDYMEKFYTFLLADYAKSFR